MTFSYYKDKILLQGPDKTTQELEKGVYLLTQDQLTGAPILKPKEDFKTPSKIYGNYLALAQRYVNTFKTKSGNLGIALVGEKGTGKSLLAKLVCIEAKLPVLVVSEKFNSKSFLEDALSSIKQECIIFLDEFEKNFKGDDQHEVLSIMDGALEGRKLFLLTSNDIRLSNFLTNRPGRIYYYRRFVTLEPDIIEAMIVDNLHNIDYKKDIYEVLESFTVINADMVLSLINESNLYKESPKDSVKHLNLILEAKTTFDIEILFDDDVVGTAVTYRHPLVEKAVDLSYTRWHFKDTNKKNGSEEVSTSYSTKRSFSLKSTKEIEDAIQTITWGGSNPINKFEKLGNGKFKLYSAHNERITFIAKPFAVSSFDLL